MLEMLRALQRELAALQLQPELRQRLQQPQQPQRQGQHGMAWEHARQPSAAAGGQSPPSVESKAQQYE